MLKLGLATGAVSLLGGLRCCGYATATLPPLSYLSPTAAAILASAMEAVLPDGAVERAEVLHSHLGVVDNYLAANPTMRSELVQLLYALEHTTPILGGYVRRFSRLPLPARRTVLHAWKQSGWRLCCVGSRGLVCLCYLAHYRLPEAWEAIGYTGPILPVFDGLEPSRSRYAALLAAPGTRPTP